MSLRPFHFFFLLCSLASLSWYFNPTAIVRLDDIVTRNSTSSGIFVLGMHHSGTSLLTALLQLSGVGVLTHEVATDVIASNGTTASQSGLQLNPQGFYEPVEMQVINNVLLRNVNHSWMSICRLNTSQFADVERVSTLRTRKAAELLVARARQMAIRNSTLDSWAMKDPRTCLTLRYWLELTREEDRVCVILYRPAPEVALSMLRYHHLEPNIGLAMWESYLVAVVNSCRHLRSYVVRYLDLLRDPVGEIEKLLAWLKQRPMVVLAEAERSYLTRFTLRNLRHSVSNVSTKMWPEVKELDGVLSIGGGDVLQRAWSVLWKRKGLQVSDVAQGYLCTISPYRRPWILGMLDSETNVTLADVYGPSEVPM